jgi:hypothetical protein
MNISKVIINRVVKEMLDNAQDMGKIVIVPNTYDVYIHTEDFEDVRHFLNILREQIIERLDHEIKNRSKSNKSEGNRLTRILNSLLGYEAIAGNKVYRRVNENWDINFQECHGKIYFSDKVIELNKGEVGIVRNFSSLEQHNLDSQLKTLVTIYHRDDSVKKNVFETATSRATVPSSPKLATLKYKYKDSAELHSYHMVKDRIIIGRLAGKSEVDLSLIHASNHISDRHLEIKFDEKDGKFLLKSMGTFGTTLNGEKVPDSQRIVTGRTEDLNLEVELADEARISLAGGEVVIDFYIGSSKT